MKARDITDRQLGRYPLVSLAMGLLATGLFLLGETGEVLQYDRAAIAAGEIWRLFTGHWFHWSFDHFLWCTMVFVCVGGICEQVCRRGFAAALAAATVVIGPGAYWFAPDLSCYRGLSGLGSGLFVFGSVALMRVASRNRDRTTLLLAAGSGLLFIGKVLFEYLTGQSLFVNEPGLFVPVPLVHLLGGMTGLVVTALYWRKI